ncbi:MAG: sigma-70 family RNA polymerase sigma factor [Chloroflexi bacterium]|nr:sigma-70 family RNA polymerase sigma factor [Chloroflexota bacterium]
MQDWPDDEVLARAIAGDREAFGELYRRYVQRIYTYIYYRVANHHDAEDLTARVFYRALRNIHRYEDRGLPFSAYLYRIAHNVVANWHRDNQRRAELPLDLVWNLRDTSLPPEHQVLREETNQRLLEALRRLPPERQTLLILKFVEGLSNAEIAQIMGRSEGAIKSLYHRTLVALRRLLAEMDDDAAQAPQAPRSGRQRAGGGE